MSSSFHSYGLYPRGNTLEEALLDASVAGEDAPSEPDDGQDRVARWLDNISVAPADPFQEQDWETPVQNPAGGENASLPPETTSPADLDPGVRTPASSDTAPSVAACHCSSESVAVSGEAREDGVDQNLASLAAIQLLKGCYMLPAEYFALDIDELCPYTLDHGGGIEPYLVSSLSTLCRHCSFPTGGCEDCPDLRISRHRCRCRYSHCHPICAPWRSGFDGPGGSSSEPATEDSKVPPTPASPSEDASRKNSGRARAASAENTRIYRLFGYGRKRRLPRVLNVTECSHLYEPRGSGLREAISQDANSDGGQDVPAPSGASSPQPRRSLPNNLPEVLAANLGEKSANASTETLRSSKPDSETPEPSQGPPTNTGVARQIKETMKHKLHSLNQKLQRSSSATVTTNDSGKATPDARERRRLARRSMESHASSAGSRSPFDSPLSPQPQRGADDDAVPIADSDRSVLEPVAVGGMMIATAELDRLTAKADQAHSPQTRKMGRASGDTSSAVVAPPNTPASHIGRAVAQAARVSPDVPPNTPASGKEPPGTYFPMRNHKKKGGGSRPSGVHVSGRPEGNVQLITKPLELSQEQPASRQGKRADVHDEEPVSNDTPKAGRTSEADEKPSAQDRKVSFDEKQVAQAELRRMTRIVDRALQRLEQPDDAASSPLPGAATVSRSPGCMGVRDTHDRLRSPPPGEEMRPDNGGGEEEDLSSAAGAATLGPLGTSPTVTSTSSSPRARRASAADAPFLELTESPVEAERRRYSSPEDEPPSSPGGVLHASQRQLPPAGGRGGGHDDDDADADTGEASHRGVAPVEDYYHGGQQAGLIRQSSSGTVHVLEWIESSSSDWESYHSYVSKAGSSSLSSSSSSSSSGSESP